MAFPCAVGRAEIGHTAFGRNPRPGKGDNLIGTCDQRVEPLPVLMIPHDPSPLAMEP